MSAGRNRRTIHGRALRAPQILEGEMVAVNTTENHFRPLTTLARTFEHRPRSVQDAEALVPPEPAEREEAHDADGQRERELSAEPWSPLYMTVLACTDEDEEDTSGETAALGQFDGSLLNEARPLVAATHLYFSS